jgi:hypothetical protein
LTALSTRPIIERPGTTAGDSNRGLYQFTDSIKDAMNAAKYNIGEKISMTQPLVDLYNGVVTKERTDEKAVEWQMMLIAEPKELS